MKLPLRKQTVLNEIHIMDDFGNEVVWKADKRYADNIIKACNLFPELVEELEKALMYIENNVGNELDAADSIRNILTKAKDNG